MEATPDNRRAFVAAGAAIRVLDVETVVAGQPPTPIEGIEIPFCAPEAMVYHQPNASLHHLYIAGGTLGLWRVELCTGLFATPPVPCGEPYYSYPSATRPSQIGIIDNGMQRKRCLDLCIIPNNAAAGAPLLLALFAAQRDSLIGASEVRIFRLDTNGGCAPYPAPALNSITFNSTADWPDNSAGTSIAADPADPNFVYVGLGKGGLARVDITGPNFLISKINRPACALLPLGPCPHGESVRDLAIAATATQGSFLYVASEYTGLLEYRIPPGPTTPPSTPTHPGQWQAQIHSLPDLYAERVAAMTVGGDHIFIAAATQASSAIVNDTPAPFRNTGHWSNICADVGRPDANLVGLTISGGDKRVYWLDRDASVLAFSPTARTSFAYDHHWGSLLLRQRTTHDYRLYSCSLLGASDIRELRVPNSSPPPSAANPSLGAPIVVSGKHLDWALALGDGVVSTINPSVGLFGPDGPSAPAASEGLMPFITPPPTEDIIVIPGTSSLCNPAMPSPPAGSGCNLDAPNPFQGGLLDVAHWLDPVNPAKEWFMVGDSLTAKKDPFCSGNEPCASACGVHWMNVLHPQSGVSAISSQGWRVVQLTPQTSSLPASTLVPPTPLKWWQVESPTDPLLAQLKSDSTPYVTSRLLPDLNADGYPRLIIAVRSGAESGLKLFRPQDLRPRTLNSYCASYGGSTGVGEILLQGGGFFPPWSEAVTHPEFEATTTGVACYPWVHCGAGVAARPRAWYNTQSDSLFNLDQNGNARWGCVVASGFVATHPNALLTERCAACPGPQPGCPSNCQGLGPQHQDCVWDSYYGRALIGVYDVHSAAMSAVDTTMPKAVPVRFGIGPDPAVHGYTHAWAVRARYYPAQEKTYAFVGDLLGKLLVYDVTMTFAHPAPTQGTYLPSNPLLTPVAVLAFPNDASDGFNVNCTDIELDESAQWAYCALSRGGFAIVNIMDPANPLIQAIIDTPGIAAGLALRKNQNGVEQLLVGDGVGGMRLYGRTGTGIVP